MSETSLRAKTATNIGYNSLVQLCAFVLQGMTSIALAQNLMASDYGIVGFSQVLVSFLARFNELGVSSAIIQKHDISEREYSTAFTLRFLLGILMLGIIVATSGFAARLLNNAAAGPVIKILSLNFIIASFGFIPGM